MRKNAFTKKELPEQPLSEAAAAPEDMVTKTAKAKSPMVEVKISPPNIKIMQFNLVGSSHLVVNRFSNKAQEEMEAVQKAGSTSRSRKKRSPKDFDALFEAAKYMSAEGWLGLHAAALRNAMISSCRLVDFKMTLAKQAIFIVEDGYDKFDGTPLLRIYGGEPKQWVAPVRNANGSFDLRTRPRWDPGDWGLKPRIRFDSDIFTATDVTNLIARVGFQVGLGEGRPDSKNSPGIGYGLFELRAQVDSEVDKEGEKAA